MFSQARGEATAIREAKRKDVAIRNARVRCLERSDERVDEADVIDIPAPCRILVVPDIANPRRDGQEEAIGLGSGLGRHGSLHARHGFITTVKGDDEARGRARRGRVERVRARPPTMREVVAIAPGPACARQ